jgi:hypothetical protein
VILILEVTKKIKNPENKPNKLIKKKTIGFKRMNIMFLFIFKLFEDNINFLYMLEFQLIKIEQ